MSYYDKTEAVECIQPSTISLRQELEMQLERANAEVKRISELLQLLDANPDVQRILQLIGRRY